MPDPAPPATGTPVPPPQGTGSVTVPEETEKKFPDLIALIRKSESMNDEERQYWINILPIMTPDQLQSLRDILDNEQRQLKAIDDKYAKQTGTVDQAAVVQRVGEERRKQREGRQSAETSHKQQEEQEAENLLRQIETQS